MTTIGIAPHKRRKHRTVSELLTLSQAALNVNDHALWQRQALAHRQSAEASPLPRLKAHYTALADHLDIALMAYAERNGK